MSYESTAEPIKIGYLMDFTLPPGFPPEMKSDFTQVFDLVFDEAVEQGTIDRPVQMIYREVEGLPKGSVKAVIDAFGELVDEGCIAVFGPHITDNCVPTREAIEERFKVPAISVTGTDDWLGEWTFAFPQGSMTDEPIFLADLVAKRGLREIGVLVEQNLIGESYLKNLRAACRRKGIRIVAEAAIAQTAQDINEAVSTLHQAKAEAIVHLGFGFGIVFINPALEAVNWDPPRFTTTAFQNAWVNPIMWNAFMGWIGVDQYDEANRLGQDFLDRYAERYAGRRPEYCVLAGQSRRRRDVGAGLRRRSPAQPARRQRGTGAGEDDARRRGRTRHSGVVRQMDPPRLDGGRLPGGPHAGCRRRQLAPGRPIRGRRVSKTMSTDQSAPPAAGTQPGAPQRNWGGWIASAALAAFALFFIANCRVALDPRVANPNVHGRPRPVKFTFGLDYITFLDGATVVALIVLVVVFIRGWRRNPGSPVMLMFLCTTLIVWQDPIMNWSPFAVYNPDLVHWPESWPLVSLSPTVEPFVVFGYVMFYFGPYFPAVWILRKLQAKYGPTSYVSRHPLVSLGLLALRDRLRLRCVPGKHPHSLGHVHLLAGDPVGLGVHRHHLPVPADLGIVLGDAS